MIRFDSLAQVQKAVKDGKKVYWSNNNYVVGVDLLGQWYITYRPWSKNPNTVGLFWTDGVTSDYDPLDFYSEDAT